MVDPVKRLLRVQEGIAVLQGKDSKAALLMHFRNA